MRTVNRVGCPSVAAVHERGDERVVSIPKGVCSAHTQAALTGARTTHAPVSGTTQARTLARAYL